MAQVVNLDFQFGDNEARNSRGCWLNGYNAYTLVVTRETNGGYDVTLDPRSNLGSITPQMWIDPVDTRQLLDSRC